MCIGLLRWCVQTNAYPCDGMNYIKGWNTADKFCTGVIDAWSDGMWANRASGATMPGCNSKGSGEWYGNCLCDTVDNGWTCGCSWCLKTTQWCAPVQAGGNKWAIENSCGCDDYRTCQDRQYVCWSNYFFLGRAPLSSETCSLCTISCNAGYYSRAACTKTSDLECVKCPSGYYCRDSTKELCPAGSYCTEGVSGPSSCSVGSSSESGASVCGPCLKYQQYSNADTNNLCASCTTCLGGVYVSTPCTSTTNAICTSCGALPGLYTTWKPTSASCEAVCSIGYYSIKGACAQCTFGFYKDWAGNENCTRCVNFFPPPEPAGFYWTQDVTTSATRCNEQFTAHACDSTLLKPLEYYTVGCTAASCATNPQVTLCVQTMGYYHECNTGLSSSGMCVQCVLGSGIAAQSCVSALTPVGQQWCPAQICSDTCSAGRYSQLGCHGKACSTTCQDLCPSYLRPLNAQWSKNTSFIRNKTTADPQSMAISCAYTCNSGYFKNKSLNGGSGGCQACATSGCSVGTYRQTCLPDGSDATTPTCLNCPNKPSSFGTTDFALWLTSISGTQTCSWNCKAGSYYDQAANQCQSCSLTDVRALTCDVGTFRSATCVTNDQQPKYGCHLCGDGVNSYPSYAGNGQPPFSFWVPIGASMPDPSYAYNNPTTTCPWRCNFGYYLKNGTCIPWSKSTLDCGPFQMLVPGSMDDYWKYFVNLGEPYCKLYLTPQDPSLLPSYNAAVLACGSSSLEGQTAGCKQALTLFNSYASVLYDFQDDVAAALQTAMSSCADGTYSALGIQWWLYPIPSGQCYADQQSMITTLFHMREYAPGSMLNMLRCAAGAYYVASSSTCASCPVGTYSSVNKQTYCEPCSSLGDNYFTTNIGNVACLPPVRNQAGILSSRPGFSCNAGYMAGLYSGEQAACVPCSDYVSPTASATFSITTVWDDQPFLAIIPAASVAQCGYASFTCIPGYYLAQGACIACPIPTNAVLSPIGSSDASMTSACNFTCNAGYVADMTGRTCTRCANPSTACRAGFQQQPCPLGTSVDVCSSCNGTLPDPHQAWDAGCSRACNSGYAYANATACVPCGLGTYLPNATSTRTSCLVCASGYAVEKASAATSCTQCPSLTPRTSDSKVGCTLPWPPCPAGFFQPYPYNWTAPCAACPTGAFCSPDAVNSSSQGNITLCPYSSYYSPTYSVSALNCTAGARQCRWTPLADVTREYVPWKCPDQTHSLSMAESALQCRANAGYWYTPVATLDGTRGAAVCPVDTYCPDSAIQPVRCPSSAPFAGVGCANVTCCMATPPLPCRAGYFANTSMANSTASCVMCPPGAYCVGGFEYPQACDVNASVAYYSAAGALSLAACYSPVLSTSVVCPANTVGPVYANGSLATVRTLEQCRGAAGYYYHPKWGASAIVCPVGFYCPLRSLWPIACRFVVCNAGFYQTATVSSLCPAGSYDVSSSVSRCLACNVPANSTAAYYFKEAGSCTVCCGVGFYYVNGTCARVSRSCAYNVSLYTPASLDPCAQTQVTNACSGVCDPPPYGTVLVWNDTAPCTWACAAGFAWSSSGCMPCNAGTYKAQAGNTSACISCQSGVSGVCDACGVSPLYAPAAGATGCSTCPVRSVASKDATRCMCVPGTFMNDNQDACVQCSSASVATNWGSLFCDYCPPGYMCSVPH